MTRALSPFSVTSPTLIKSFLVKSYFTFLVAFFSLTLGTGQLGYGEDVIESYRGGGLWWLNEKPTELLGWFLSTLQYSLFGIDIFWGAILASFTLSYGLIRLSLSVFQDSARVPLYLIATITFLHFSHPILFGSLNVLRQGFAMGFFYIAISYLLNKMGLAAALFSILAIMTHNSIIALVIPLYATFYTKGHFRILIVCLGVLLVYYASMQDIKSTQATGMDQKSLYLFFMTFYAAIYYFFRKKPHNLIAHRRDLLSTSMLVAIPSIVMLIDRDSAFARLSMAWFLPAFLIGAYVSRIPLSMKKVFLLVFTMLIAFVTVLSPAIQSYALNS